MPLTEIMRQQAKAEAMIASGHLKAPQILPLRRQQFFEHLSDARVMYLADNHRYIDRLDTNDAVAIHALDVYLLARVIGLDDDGRRLIDFLDCERDGDTFVVGAGMNDYLAGILHVNPLHDLSTGQLATNEVDEIGKRILFCQL